MFNNRQGIAPIIATLVLISFAVVIGVVVMNFGRAQVQLESKCAADIGLIFSEIGGEKQISEKINPISAAHLDSN